MLVHREQASRLIGLHGEDLTRDGPIEPRKNCEVLLCLVGITLGCWSVIDVVENLEFAEHDGEERAPHGVIRGFENKGNWD